MMLGRRYRLLFVMIVLPLVGCLAKTDQITNDARLVRAEQDLQRLNAVQEPLAGPIDFKSAASYALRHNLDYRVRIFEEFVSKSQFEVVTWDLLPRVEAEAGYYSRSNEPAATSKVLSTGSTSSFESVSADKHGFTYSIPLVINSLDIGINYARAKQASDQQHISFERRRKIAQNVVQETITAYWFAVAAQSLLPAFDELIAYVRSTAASMQTATKQGLVSGDEGVRFERELYATLDQLLDKRVELQSYRLKFAALLGLPPQSIIRLAHRHVEPAAVWRVKNLEPLVAEALANRPELAQEDYTARITSYETMRALLSIFPSLKTFDGPRYDSNSYLLYNNWAAAGATVSMNLLKVLSLPAIKAQQDAQQELNDTRRLQVSMAVYIQVHLAAAEIRNNQLAIDIAQRLHAADEKLVASAKSQVQAEQTAVFELARRRTLELFSRTRLAFALARSRDLAARMENALGRDHPGLKDLDAAEVASTDAKGL